MVFTLLELYKDFVGPTGTEPIGPPREEIHIQERHRDTQFPSRPTDRTGDKTACAHDDRAVSSGELPHGDPAALLESHRKP